jgi:hypothetical protein
VLALFRPGRPAPGRAPPLYLVSRPRPLILGRDSRACARPRRRSGSVGDCWKFKRERYSNPGRRALSRQVFKRELHDPPSSTSLSRHISKKPFTSAATSAGKSCEAAPSAVQGHMRPSDTAVPRKAFIQTRRGSGSFSSSASMNLEVSSAQRRTTAAARSSFVGKW